MTTEIRRVERTVVVCGDVEQTWDDVVGCAWLGDDVVLEPRRGADGYVRDGDEVRHLIVEDLVRHCRLVFRWWPLTPDGVGPASRVEIDVEPQDDEDTRVRVVETPVPPATPLPSPSGPVALATW